MKVGSWCWHKKSAPGAGRTRNHQIRSLLLCPLSYGGKRRGLYPKKESSLPWKSRRRPELVSSLIVCLFAVLFWLFDCKCLVHAVLVMLLVVIIDIADHHIIACIQSDSQVRCLSRFHFHFVDVCYAGAFLVHCAFRV